MRVPNPGQRVQTITLNEPIAGPDRHALGKSWSVTLLKDRKAHLCMLGCARGESSAVADTTCAR